MTPPVGKSPDNYVPHHRRGVPVSATPELDADDPPFRRSVVIAYDGATLVWDAYYILDAHNAHEHAEFVTVEEAIAWARERCDWITVADPHTSEPRDLPNLD